jgi:thiamine biosynthesis protein ThiS
MNLGGFSMREMEPIWLTLNHKKIQIQPGTTVSELLRLKGFSQSVAVFVNKKHLLMKSYSVFELNEADIVTVFRPLGGG